MTLKYTIMSQKYYNDCMHPRHTERLPFDKQFRSKKAAELHDLIMKCIADAKPEYFFNQIESHIEKLRHTPEDLMERSRSGFTYLADILHLPYLLYRDKQLARNRAIPLFNQFVKHVDSPELIKYFIMQKSYGAYNLLHTVIDADDSILLEIFLNYLSQMHNKGIISKEDINILLKDEDIHGNNALHLIGRKNNLNTNRLFIDWLKSVFGAGVMMQEVLGNLLNHRNKAGYKPSSKNHDIRQLFGHLRGLDDEQLRKKELDHQLQMNYEREVMLEEKEKDLAMREAYLLDQMQSMQRENEDLRARTNEDYEQIRQYQAEVDHLSRRIDDVQRELHITRQERMAFHEKMEQENFALRKRGEILREDLDFNHTEMNRFRNLYEMTDSKAQMLEGDNLVLQREYKIAQDKIKQLEAALAAAQEKAKQSEAALLAAQAKAAQQKHRHVDMKEHKKEEKHKDSKKDKRDASPVRTAIAGSGVDMWRAEDRVAHEKDKDKKHHSSSKHHRK